MDKIFRFKVIVTTPYPLKNRRDIQLDMTETLKIAIEQIIKDQMDSFDIIGLGVIVESK